VEGGNLSASYFHSLRVTIRHCNGNPSVAVPKHWDVDSHAKPNFWVDLSPESHKEFKGNAASWFEHYTNVNPAPGASCCWRHLDQALYCDGSASILEVCLSLPVILLITPGMLPWDFPLLLCPSGETAESKHSAVYTMIGRSLFSKKKSHFIARYESHEDGIFTFDSMAQKGYSHQDNEGTLNTHLAGTSVKCPPGFKTQTVVYALLGGTEAQTRLMENRIALLKSTHGLTFSETDPGKIPEVSFTCDDRDLMSNSDRIWLKTESSGLYLKNEYTGMPSVS
jgi:hypothetical protein